jgi:hypothetical protein
MAKATQSKLLDVESYNAAETAAADKNSIRVNQAFFPEMFATVGYPARVERVDQLWRYIDVMHETRTDYNMDVLLHGLTAHEFELFKEVTRIVDSHATLHYNRRAHASASLLRAIHVLRLIKIATGDERPAVLEVGPGCGYLAMLLVLEGYPYIGTDIAQSFYLYQSHMLSHVATNLMEMAIEDGDLLSLETPKPGTAVHIPWWKWVTLSPDKIKLSAGIMTSNHCLCEMHANSFAYLASVSSGILGRHQGGGRFVFDSWGYDLLHGEEVVLTKFMDHGFRLCHNEVGVSAMALKDHVQGWPVYRSDFLPGTTAKKGGVVETMNRMPRLKKPLLAAIKRIPGLRRVLLALLLPPAPGTSSPQVPEFKAANPLSQRLTAGRNAVFEDAAIKMPEIRSFLETYFNGAIPEHPDETFFNIIGTRQ